MRGLFSAVLLTAATGFFSVALAQNPDTQGTSVQENPAGADTPPTFPVPTAPAVPLEPPAREPTPAQVPSEERALAVPAASGREVVNEVLFSLTGESFTSRDLRIFGAVLKEIFHRDRLGEFSADAFQDFILSRLAYREAQVFELKVDARAISEAEHRRLAAFSAAEVAREADIIAKSLNWIELKENQVKQRERFNIWLDVLKRKYQLRIKGAAPAPAG